jgi:capsular polysaccharide biosynthesis protein
MKLCGYILIKDILVHEGGGHMKEFKEVELKDILNIIKKRIGIIILMPIIFALIGAIISSFILNPVYEASTTIIVMQNLPEGKEISKTDVDLSKSLIYTYAEMITSNTVINNTKNTLNLESINKDSVAVSAVKDTQILEVRVQNENPQIAMDIANTIVKEFMAEVLRITRTDNVAVVDYAVLPENPIKPNVLLNTLISGIIGLMLVLMIVFIAEYLDNTLKTENDIEKHLKISVIGSIYEFRLGEKYEHEYEREYGKHEEIYGEKSSIIVADRSI